MISIAFSISSRVLPTPRLIRTEFSIIDFSSPIASNTGDNSLLPLAQAEPVEIANPFMSAAIRKDCRSTSGNDKLLTCGNRVALTPLMTKSGNRLSSVFSRWFRNTKTSE